MTAVLPAGAHSPKAGPDDDAPAPAPSEGSAASPQSWLLHIGDAEANAPRGFPRNFVKTSHYTLLNFLPLNLFHQFQNLQNIYFLTVMLFSIVGDSPITEASAVVPLVMVLTVSAVKEGWEDYKRHQADAEDNAGLVMVLQERQWVATPSIDVRVGDVILLERNTTVKADVVVLSSDDDDGVVYVETSQLDGETNVKTRKALPETQHLQTAEQIADAMAAPAEDGEMPHLEVDLPNPKLYVWQGVMQICGTRLALSAKNAIWRGSYIRKCNWAACVVIYTGPSTKQGMNLRPTKQKYSFLSTKVNYIVLSIFIVKQILIFPMCGMAAFVWPAEHKEHWYGHFYDTDLSAGAAEFGMKYMTYFILLSFMIPISLFVTLEMCKVAQFLAMRWDHYMLHFMPGVGWVGCRPKTSDLNDQLAVVRYVFSDKTGTLTENIMRYIQGAVYSPRAGVWVEHNENLEPGSIGAVSALDVHAAAAWTSLLSTTSRADDVARYLACMSLCNTVVPFTAPGTFAVSYEGTSPDEVALVSAAANNGFELKKRTSRSVTIRIGANMHDFAIAAELEFTPTRKMMSVVLEDDTGRLTLLTKGADSSVLKCLAAGDSNAGSIATCNGLVTNYARQQYRTLLFGYREVSRAKFDAWKAEYDSVNTKLGKTDEELDAVCLQLEAGLQLVGVAAYEDKLQDGVNETIRFLTDAGLTFWMLTGDKIETGIEIGKACGLATDAEIFPLYIKEADVDHHMSSVCDACTASSDSARQGEAARQRREKEVVVESKIQAAIELAQRVQGERKFCIAIDGTTFDIIESQGEGNLRRLFFELSAYVHSAMCCRLTPSQKGFIVKLFQQETGQTVLAIGDGANDATMITAATVGIGIIGLEGSQAELASDYAIPRFRFLTRLLAVHGRYAVYRNARCVCLSFYKNIVLSLCMVLYSSVSGFSGTALFDSWILAVKNTLFDFFPPFLIGCYGIDLSDEVLLHPAHGPGLYAQMRTKELYCSPVSIGLWIASALFHGVVIWFYCLPTLRQDDVDPAGGRHGGLVHGGTYVMTMVLVTVLAKAALHIHQMTAIQAGGLIVSFLLYPLFLVVYSALPSLFGDTNFHGMAPPLLSDPKHYLLAALAIVGITIVVDFTVLYVQRHFFPTLRDAFADNYPYKDPVDSKDRAVLGLWSHVAHGIVPVVQADGDEMYNMEDLSTHERKPSGVKIVSENVGPSAPGGAGCTLSPVPADQTPAVADCQPLLLSTEPPQQLPPHAEPPPQTLLEAAAPSGHEPDAAPPTPSTPADTEPPSAPSEPLSSEAYRTDSGTQPPLASDGPLSAPSVDQPCGPSRAATSAPSPTRQPLPPLGASQSATTSTPNCPTDAPPSSPIDPAPPPRTGSDSTPA